MARILSLTRNPPCAVTPICWAPGRCGEPKRSGDRTSHAFPYHPPVSRFDPWMSSLAAHHFPNSLGIRLVRRIVGRPCESVVYVATCTYTATWSCEAKAASSHGYWLVSLSSPGNGLSLFSCCQLATRAAPLCTRHTYLRGLAGAGHPILRLPYTIAEEWRPDKRSIP